eukprot:14386794-Heterocapsa_arctica.AAC.1
MGSNLNGAQDIPINSQEFEHWHAWEAELDCIPEGENPLGPDASGGEVTWDAIYQVDAEAGFPQQVTFEDRLKKLTSLSW